MDQQEAKRNRFLRWPEVHKRVGLCHSQVYSLMRKFDSEGNPSFPLTVKLGARASGWLESEIEQWILDRVNESRMQGERE